MLPRAAALSGLMALAACGSFVPPSSMSDIPMRAPSLPPAQLVVALPELAPAPRPVTASLTRGAEAVCMPRVQAVLQPVAPGRFLLVMEQPGFAVTRETVLRRTVGGGPAAPQLAMDGANNGRCDYLFS